MNRRFHTLTLLALSAGIYLGTAVWTPLLDSTDAAHAEAAREMLATGDWTILHMNGIRYLEKPPLHYWLVALSYKAFGVSAFTTRLPVALAVVGLVLMTYAFGRRWFGERAGFYAGLVMCTAPGTFLFTRIMIPEAIYTLEFLGIFYLFLRAWQGSLSPRRGYWGAAILLALATLTRSLVGIVFPLAILALFLVANGGWRRLRGFPWVSSFLIFLCVSLPWHVKAILSTPRFFWFYFVNEQVLRALGKRIPHDYAAVPLLAWWGAHIIWFFPWIVFLPFAVKELPKPGRWRRLDTRDEAKLLLLIWAVFTLLFFSWTASRMEYYSFSAWPAIALFLGLGLDRAEEQASPWLPRLQTGLAVAGVLIAAVLGGLLWVSRGIPSTGDITSLLQSHPPSFYRVAMADFFDLTSQAFAGLRGQAAAAIVVVLFGFLGAGWLRWRGKGLSATLVTAGTMAAFFFCANWALGALEPRLSSRVLAGRIGLWMRPGDQLVLYGEYDSASSLAFYTGRRLWIYNGCYNGLEFGSHYPDAPRIFLDDGNFHQLWGGPLRVFLVVPEDLSVAALERLPEAETYFVTHVGEKSVYVNQPLVPHQPSLADLRARGRDQSSPPPETTPPGALLRPPEHAARTNALRGIG